jgi:hypothetical protein
MLIRVTIVVWAATLSQQLLAQEYIGSHGGLSRVIKVNSDYTFNCTESNGCIAVNYYGTYKVLKDTLVLNTFAVPHDSLVEVQSTKNDSLKLLFRFRDKASRYIFINRVSLWNKGVKKDICNKQTLDSMGVRAVWEIKSNFDSFDSLEISTLFTNKTLVIKSVIGHNDYTIIVDRTYDVMFDIYNEKYIWRRNKLSHIGYKLVLRRKGALVWW